MDAALERRLPAETGRPRRFTRAMRYSIFAGGKRLRPVLVIGGRGGGGRPHGAGAARRAARWR